MAGLRQWYKEKFKKITRLISDQRRCLIIKLTNTMRLVTIYFLILWRKKKTIFYDSISRFERFIGLTNQVKLNTTFPVGYFGDTMLFSQRFLSDILHDYNYVNFKENKIYCLENEMNIHNSHFFFFSILIAKNVE